MIPVLNDIDRLLDLAPSRYGQAIDREIVLSSSARAFDVALDGTVSPAAIVFIASTPGMAGVVQFSTDNGTELVVAGNVATLTPAALVGSGVTVTISLTVDGQPYFARQTVARLLAFDSSVPPAPSGLATAGALASVQLIWAPTNNVNFAKVEIWRALTNNLAVAEPVGSTAGLARQFSDNIGSAGAFYYWIRYVSKANVIGPFNSTVGTLGTAGTDADHLLALLADRITESQLLASLRDRIDLVDAAGTGLVDKVGALVTTYGDTAASASSAAAAAASAADAVQARATALIAAGDSVGAANEADAYRLQAQASNAAAGTSATAALSSSNSASSFADSAGTAAAASSSARLAAEAASGTALGASNAAVTARDTAVTKAGEAGTSAASASTSANTASTKAGEASSSSTSAATSASGAAGSANNASTSASNAATSASGASGSASAAAGSASTAGTHASNAGTSATAANTARVAAETARDNASGSASAASTSAQAAGTHASNAGTSASAASTSANTASTKAGEALAYRNSAASSESNALGHANAAAQDYVAINARLNSVSGSGVSVEQKLTASADSILGLSAQVTVKIDNNGHIAGYGLASTPVNGIPTSAFAILADSFMVVGPNGPVPMFSIAGGVVGFSGKLVGPSGHFGVVTIGEGGSLSSGQTSFGVGVGFWIQGGTTPKLSLGTAGASLLCDPANNVLSFNGGMINGTPAATIVVNAASGATAAIKLTTPITGRGAGSAMTTLYASRNGSGILNMGTRTAVGTGGVGPYTYEWSVDGDEAIVISGGKFLATVSLRSTGGTTYDTWYAVARCKILDASSNLSGVDSVDLVAEYN